MLGKSRGIAVVAGMLGAVLAAPAVRAEEPAAVARITVAADRPGAAVSPLLYGIFFEEINRAGDGGIYAEMVQNRSFEDAADRPVAWTAIGGGTVSLDKSRPLNTQNPTSLRLEIPAGGKRVGVGNAGFVKDAVPEPRRAAQGGGGIAVQRGKAYDLSFYARAAGGFSGPVTATLESADGTVLASQRVSGVGADWKKFSVSLTASTTDPAARLVVSASDPGVLWLDMVSLFPRDTWKGRKNGLRADLMGYIERMRPAFVRFPGGCFVEGDRIENAFRWKETVGDIAERPGHWNLWGYRSTDGLGFHEYLQMCEDLKAEPLFVINCGMSHANGRLNAHAVPLDQMGRYVQDALDAVEYANGPVTSQWGALRAKNGHPKPFGLKYLQIGNENGGPDYNERYALFHDAVKAKYPGVRLVACDWGGVPGNRPLDVIDPHLYSDPGTMLLQTARFDGYPRTPGAPKVYFGEYAVTSREAGTGSLEAAVAEAAFMTGFERNGDVVAMSSYAPLLSHIDWKAWNPNAIVYDQARVYGTPSYHVQALFSRNRADRVLPVTIAQPPAAPQTPRGMVGVGTWRTQAEYKDITVIKNGQTLLAADFTKGLAGWKTSRGKWEAADGVLRQSGDEENVRAVAGDPSWSDYTLTLKARKLGGREGFLVMFQAPGDDTTSWWNLGGWDNTEHALQVPGVPDNRASRVRGSIETGRWYDIRVELKGQSIKAYLDGRLVHDVTRPVPPALYAVAGRDERTGEVVLKVVNASARPLETDVDLQGLGSGEGGTLRGTATVLTSAGGPRAENSFAAPMNLVPREEPVRAAAGPSGAAIRRTFPAYSVTVLRLKAASPARVTSSGGRGAAAR